MNDGYDQLQQLVEQYGLVSVLNTLSLIENNKLPAILAQNGNSPNAINVRKQDRLVKLLSDTADNVDRMNNPW